MMVLEEVLQSPSSNGTKNGAMGGDGHAACRFYVQIGANDGGKQIQALFTEVSGLQVEMQIQEYEEGGTNTYIHKLPGRLKVSNVTMKHGLTKSNDFLHWCLNLERRNVSVVMYDSVGKPVIRWNFAKAYPVKW